MPKSSVTPELLDKYLLGQCTAEEILTVESWYASQRGTKDYLSSLSGLERQLLEEETLKNIKSTLNEPFDEEEQTPKKLSFWRNRLVQVGMAASFLLICWVSWSYFQSLKSINGDDTLFGVVKPVNQSNMIHFTNKETKMVMHFLPDSTQVWLHPNAELTYPKTFDIHSRQVTFVGEGFFDVVHDKSRPFLIQSDKMQIRVLGTKFNIKALPKQAVFQVAVVSGSVAVRSVSEKGNANPETIVLKPQQKVLFEVATNHMTTLETVAEAKKEIFEPISINFNDTPMGEVIEQLQRQFNIHIQLSNKAMLKCLLTADFSNQSLAAILEIMCASLDANYTLSDNNLIFKGSGCE